MLTDDRRTELVIQMTDTLWQLNRPFIIAQVEANTKRPMPDECLLFMEYCVRIGAVLMERALRKDMEGATR